jgi:hypothetical protein
LLGNTICSKIPSDLNPSTLIDNLCRRPWS